MQAASTTWAIKSTTPVPKAADSEHDDENSHAALLLDLACGKDVPSVSQRRNHRRSMRRTGRELSSSEVQLSDASLLVVADASDEGQLGDIVGGIVLIDVEKSMHHIRPDEACAERAHSGELLASAATDFWLWLGRGLRLRELRECA